MQLRFLQTVVEIAAENNSTTLFPIPIELFRSFVAPGAPASEEARARALKAAAATLIEALPADDDRGALQSAAKKMIGLDRPPKAAEPAPVGDTASEESDEA
jgi:hypothetical protein